MLIEMSQSRLRKACVRGQCVPCRLVTGKAIEQWGPSLALIASIQRQQRSRPKPDLNVSGEVVRERRKCQASLRATTLVRLSHQGLYQLVGDPASLCGVPQKYLRLPCSRDSVLLKNEVERASRSVQPGRHESFKLVSPPGGQINGRFVWGASCCHVLVTKPTETTLQYLAFSLFRPFRSQPRSIRRRAVGPRQACPR